jgi:tRNA dimethylallyltransferase
MNKQQPARDRAILLMGATATGKTGIAVQLAGRYPVEIISVDSALIYRQMDIGTAKPDPQTLQRAPHHLIDILDPAESWSAWEFVQSASGLISDINRRGRLPLLVGGTMMYFNALQQGMNDLPVADQALREELQQRRSQQGLDVLYGELQRLDPATAQRLKPTDPQRILRALEVCMITGQPMSRLLERVQKRPEIDFDRVILDVPERAQLHQRIADRFEIMLRAGFEDEVAALRARGDLDLSMPSMRCVGYRQMWQYLEGALSRDQMVANAVAATRQLAKRQLTWLRKYTDTHRLDFRVATGADVARHLRLT